MSGNNIFLVRNHCIYLFFIMVSASAVMAQDAGHYLEKIRNDEAQLTAFMQQMPKGGDLHHHYSGSVYAETYIHYVVSRNYLINPLTLEVRRPDATGDSSFRPFSAFKPDDVEALKQSLMRKWSVKDHNGVSDPSDKHFFETFPAFSPASRQNLDSGLIELKNRAIFENVSYIETMFTTIPCRSDTTGYAKWNDQLAKLRVGKDPLTARELLKKIHRSLNSKDLGLCASTYNNELCERHKRLKLDDSLFTLRYQAYLVRVIDNPADVFRSMLVAFETANISPLMVGVNIVAPEDDEISMRDYWLHMQMFAYCKSIYPNVKTSMHAGELALGMVKPEDLTWHIREAVLTAGANRIGHGVDIPWEKDSYGLLGYMAEKKIPVEINLFSNEFILKIKGNSHPLPLYRAHHVPVVICTDDAGVLRSNLTHQYVLLATRYPELKYDDIKALVYDSLHYSFIDEPAVLQQLRKDLDKRFARFEETVRMLDRH